MEQRSVKHEGQKKESAAVTARGRDKGGHERDFTDGTGNERINIINRH